MEDTLKQLDDEIVKMRQTISMARQLNPIKRQVEVFQDMLKQHLKNMHVIVYAPTQTGSDGGTDAGANGPAPNVAQPLGEAVSSTDEQKAVG